PGVDARRGREERRPRPGRLAGDPLPHHGVALPLEDGPAPRGDPRRGRTREPGRERRGETPAHEVGRAREVDRPAVGAVLGERALLSSDAGSPEVYARFAAERRRPFDDLLALVAPIPGGGAVDLGCGPGELTRELHRRVGAAETVGIDSSPAMLEKAAPLAG